MKHRRSKKKCMKVRYPSPDAARAALKKQKDSGFGVKRYYQCPYCKGSVYHLTSEGG